MFKPEGQTRSGTITHITGGVRFYCAQEGRVAGLALGRGKSADFTGYWQRHECAEITA